MILGTLGHRSTLGRALDRTLSAVAFALSKLVRGDLRHRLLDRAVGANARNWEALLHYLHTDERSAASASAERAVSRLLYEAAVLRRKHPDLFAQDAAAFGDFLYRHAGRTRSQIFQDLWVLYETKEKRGGFFVEFGATDGVAMSNTLLLERDYGWTGILAEPNPVWHKRLARNRTATIAHLAVATGPGTAAFAATLSPEIASLAAYADLDGLGRHRRHSPAIEVETVSLTGLLDRYGAPRDIDFISIDTEGSEHAILRHFDFTAYRVAMFCIEHNFSPMRQPIHGLMTANGYVRRFPQYSMFDDWYARVG